MSTIRCPQCGLINGIVDSSCQRCGYPLSQSAQNAAREQQTQQPPYPPQWQQPYTMPPPMMPMPQPMPQHMQQPAFRCTYCGGNVLVVDRKVSTGGWIVFALMILICFPLFWIGLLMKEDYHRCGTCGITLR